MKIENNVIVELDQADEKHLFIPKEAEGFDVDGYVGFFGELESIEVEEEHRVLRKEQLPYQQ